MCGACRISIAFHCLQLFITLLACILMLIGMFYCLAVLQVLQSLQLMTVLVG